ncbi:D-alanyl-D-alanine carboxypeptidase [Cohaesibacter sp. ES.047]|uniref:serine hydrolase n=1 Tax=Cohaesibacter sp. ES.047 TaxID=1798205 RepID=UPI000BC0C9EC|nr:serine hydrolase [Cohaesibacter sp. ES.047]SNY93927.1 D-alanyl-D-alanine carboxypeptidase [Cohaesibacter sp. ES.047]
MYRVAFNAIRRLRLPRPVMTAAAALTLVFSPIVHIDQAHANSKYAAYVIDVKSGKVLFSRHANAPRYPASLTKMMTLYMVFDRLESGKLKLSTPLKVSKYASGRPPSKLGLRPGSTISVRNAIYALVTKSANDVASVVAENIGGSESKFGKMMTMEARAIGMKRTTFRNASGLPNRSQKTTAADMALLGRALQDRFPGYYKYFSTRSFKYGKRRFGNHNRLLGHVKGVDGIKTGYTRASGFNLVTNVKARNRHIVAVVMGGRTGRSRDAHMRKLIKTYLPKAKTGARRTALVVAPPNRYIKLASTIRLPKAKLEPVGLPMVTAYQAPRDIKSITPAPIDLVAMPQTRPATQKARITTASLAVPPLPRPANDAIGDLSTHQPPIPLAAPKQATPSGWQIQLGATRTLDLANNLLAKARARNEKLLVARVNHTETVEKGDLTLYRARFAGFESKTAARNTCAILKKQKFACLALNP